MFGAVVRSPITEFKVPLVELTAPPNVVSVTAENHALGSFFKQMIQIALRRSKARNALD